MAIMVYAGVPDNYRDRLFSAFKTRSNKDRLLVVMYLLSDLYDNEMHLDTIETELRKVFPPSIRDGFLPKDYQNFQASVIRGQFNNQHKKSINFWENTHLGCWKNTEYGNREAEKILNELGLGKLIRNHKVKSWRSISNRLLFKSIDKSSIKYNQSFIPKRFHNFFIEDSANFKQVKNIKLIYHDNVYQAKIRKTKRNNNEEYFIDWDSNFSKFIKRKVSNVLSSIVNDEPLEDKPEIRFEKLPDEDKYAVEVVNYFMIEQDESHDFDTSVYKEGKRVQVLSSKYERDPKLRKKAIEFHGTKCAVCGFDFYDTYGSRGEGFIEIHHKKPLYKIEEEIYVDPKDDLVPLCSNCHRMIHRFKDNYLSIEDLNRIVLDKTKSSNH